MRLFRKCKQPQGLQNDFEKALISYRLAEAKIDQVLDGDLVDAAVYEYLAAQKRLNHIIRLCRRQEKLLLN